MKNPIKLKQLQQVAGLLLDAKLVEVQRAARARAQTEAMIAGLEAVPMTFDAVSPIAGELALLSYQRWADQRRIELGQTLARQTATWMDARDAAKLAFGKTQALDGVAAKLAATQPRRD